MFRSYPCTEIDCTIGGVGGGGRTVDLPVAVARGKRSQDQECYYRMERLGDSSIHLGAASSSFIEAMEGRTNDGIEQGIGRSPPTRLGQTRDDERRKQIVTSL